MTTLQYKSRLPQRVQDPIIQVLDRLVFKLREVMYATCLYLTSCCRSPTGIINWSVIVSRQNASNYVLKYIIIKIRQKSSGITGRPRRPTITQIQQTGTKMATVERPGLLYGWISKQTAQEHIRPTKKSLNRWPLSPKTFSVDHRVVPKKNAKKSARDKFGTIRRTYANFFRVHSKHAC